MKLFRVEYEWYKILDDGLRIPIIRYHYVMGERRLGRLCYDFLNEECRILNIDKLNFNLHTLKTCWHETDSNSPNKIQ